LTENEISFKVRKAIFRVYDRLGPGLFESVYQRVLALEIRKMGMLAEEQIGIPFVYEGEKFDAGFRIDILVDKKVVIEIKSIETIAEAHHKQLLTYLKLGDYKLGLLVNFNTANIHSSIFRKIPGDIALSRP
jgi:GxxExxY protein